MKTRFLLFLVVTLNLAWSVYTNVTDSVQAQKQQKINQLLVIRNNITRWIANPTLKIMKQKWTRPYNATYLVIYWKLYSLSGEYDYIAVYDKDPISSFKLNPYRYYWINRQKSQTIITDIVYTQKTEYYIAYYKYRRHRTQQVFTLIESKRFRDTISALPSQDDGKLYATQPHPQIRPQDVNLQATKEALITDTITSSYIKHSPYLTASGQHAKKINIDLKLTYDLNWYNSRNVSTWDYVAIYDHYPNHAEDFMSNQWCWCIAHSDGFCTTDVRFDRERNYYMSYVTYDFIKQSFVIKELSKYQFQSNWMRQLKNVIQPLKLKDLMIPGSHDSVSYNMTRLITTPWTQTQSEMIINQLHDGIRYFDLRVAYIKDEFWFTHDIWLTKIRVISLLTLIRDFVSRSEEIIFLDFNHFYYFNANVHDKLIRMIIDTIGDYMAPNTLTQDVTVGKLWSENKRVIVIYANKNNSEQYQDDNKLWLFIHSSWPDDDKVDDVKGTLAAEVNKKHEGLWVLQAILTPKFETSLPFSVQHLANNINRNLSKWLVTDWLHKPINIIISDFYLGNNVASIAFERNLAKGRAAQNSAS